FHNWTSLNCHRLVPGYYWHRSSADVIARVSSGRAPSALPVEYPTTTGERGSDIESMKRARPFVNAVHIANSVATHDGTDVTRGARSRGNSQRGGFCGTIHG